eukprot:GHVQ01003210.1.p1 GENE.GHVQ01003210.1~~GHVQ01003210.1.p1  ORF type:complete len:628 (+),score=57.72 GHVQ01003210.1:1294-3177(+)
MLYDACTSKAIMAFVQCRGSTPVFWTQETSAIVPKPPVLYHKMDATFTATRKHFRDLFERYGSPVVSVNLMKLTNDGSSDEPDLGIKFAKAVQCLNQELPKELEILFESIDVKHAYKRKNELPQLLLGMSERVVSKLGYLYVSGGERAAHVVRIQSGVLRTNCLDCLDRTNVAQLFIGTVVLAHHLHALAFLSEPVLDFDSQVVAVLSELYDLLGDHLSLQYGGSVTHKKYTLERPRMMKHSKELLTSLTRHYANSFADSDKQHATNMFLGILKPQIHARPWAFDSDSWLHHIPLTDVYQPGEWWVNPLQYFYNCLRVLHALPPTNRVPFQLTGHVPDETRSWYSLFGGHPRVQPVPPPLSSSHLSPWSLFDMYTYVPWRQRAALLREHSCCHQQIPGGVHGVLGGDKLHVPSLTHDSSKRADSGHPLQGDISWYQRYRPDKLSSFAKISSANQVSGENILVRLNPPSTPRAQGALTSISRSFKLCRWASSHQVQKLDKCRGGRALEHIPPTTSQLCAALFYASRKNLHTVTHMCHAALIEPSGETRSADSSWVCSGSCWDVPFEVPLAEKEIYSKYENLEFPFDTETYNAPPRAALDVHHMTSNSTYEDLQHHFQCASYGDCRGIT